MREREAEVGRWRDWKMSKEGAMPGVSILAFEMKRTVLSSLRKPE
jgi:hypothetical protein